MLSAEQLEEAAGAPPPSVLGRFRDHDDDEGAAFLRPRASGGRRGGGGGEGRRPSARHPGYTFVPLEVAPPADETIAAEEVASQVCYEHPLLSGRVSRRGGRGSYAALRPPVGKRKKCVVSALALGFLGAGAALWIWALTLLLLRLNALRTAPLQPPVFGPPMPPRGLPSKPPSGAVYGPALPPPALPLPQVAEDST